MAIRKYSRQREAIKKFLAGRKDHPTADTIYTCLREDYPNISLGTVYRNLSLLTEMGEISRITTGTGPERYDGRILPHQHFFCTCCENVLDIDSTELDQAIRTAAKDCPGQMESYSAIFYGTCKNCLRNGQSAGGVV